MPPPCNREAIMSCPDQNKIWWESPQTGEFLVMRISIKGEAVEVTLFTILWTGQQ